MLSPTHRQPFCQANHDKPSTASVSVAFGLVTFGLVAIGLAAFCLMSSGLVGFQFGHAG